MRATPSPEPPAAAPRRPHRPTRSRKAGTASRDGASAVRETKLCRFWESYAKLRLGEPLDAAERHEFIRLAPTAFGGIER